MVDRDEMEVLVQLELGDVSHVLFIMAESDPRKNKNKKYF
jgi:hypothetical protein